uniref:PGR5-like protein 1B, chloroplastic n=1 Tax=Lygus hesperus TaxID=30085 RepID=A0A0A9W014_LYGHE
MSCNENQKVNSITSRSTSAGSSNKTRRTLTPSSISSVAPLPFVRSSISAVRKSTVVGVETVRSNSKTYRSSVSSNAANNNNNSHTHGKMKGTLHDRLLGYYNDGGRLMERDRIEEGLMY